MMPAAGRAALCCLPGRGRLAAWRPRSGARGAACAAGAVLLLASAAGRDARAEEPSASDPWWGRDKALHFSLSFGVAAAGYGLSVWALDDRFAAVGLSAGATIALGAAKEGLDAAGWGQPSWRDFAWDLVGTALGVGVSVTLDAALRGPSVP
jgi:uncharacterized protein YfiM (DUF2279 family)